MADERAKGKRPGDLMDPDEAADYLGYSKGTIYNKVHRDEIPHTKVGKFLRFDPDELDRWVEAGCPRVTEVA